MLGGKLQIYRCARGKMPLSLISMSCDDPCSREFCYRKEFSLKLLPAILCRGKIHKMCDLDQGSLDGAIFSKYHASPGTLAMSSENIGVLADNWQENGILT